MKIEEIKSYEEIKNYCDSVGEENLTDKEIDALCIKVGEICEERIKKHKKGKRSSKYRAALKLMEYGIASSVTYQLTHCTDERQRAMTRQIDEAIGDAICKEARARESNRVLR